MCLSPTPAPVARPVSSAPTTPDGDPRFDVLSGAIRLPRPPRVPRMRRTRVGERLPPLRPPPLDVLVMDAVWIDLGDDAPEAEVSL